MTTRWCARSGRRLRHLRGARATGPRAVAPRHWGAEPDRATGAGQAVVMRRAPRTHTSRGPTPLSARPSCHPTSPRERATRPSGRMGSMPHDPYLAAAAALRRHVLPAVRPVRAPAARAVAGPVAQLRRRPAARGPAGDPAPGVRPRRHALRPREQLRPSVRRRRDELRPADARGPAAVPRRAGRSRRRRATTCGRGRTASGARASTCSRRWTRACTGWAWTTSTSSTRTASTRRRRSRRRWVRWSRRCAAGARCTPASRRTRRSAPRRPPRCCAPRASRC